MRERLKEIIRKEFRQAFRDTRMRTFLFLPPLIQLVIFGLAVNLDVDHAQIAWMDGDQSFQSRELLAAFQGSGRFEVVATPGNDREAQALLDANKADLVVRVLPGFERDIQRNRATSVQVLINGSNSNTANIV
jgi:ABC-2 type transport system permease protein